MAIFPGRVEAVSNAAAAAAAATAITAAAVAAAVHAAVMCTRHAKERGGFHQIVWPASVFKPTHSRDHDPKFVSRCPARSRCL